LLQAAHDAINVVLGDWLQNNAAKLVFEEFDPSARFDSVLAAEFGWDYELAF
jgi:hypothetical protein